jgi:hypothetical protein
LWGVRDESRPIAVLTPTCVRTSLSVLNRLIEIYIVTQVEIGAGFGGHA